jgi:hypothetical protein
MHAAELLVPKPSSEGEIATEKLKRYKSLSMDHILAELIQAGGNTLSFEIHKHINAIWNKEELPQQWKGSITEHICRQGDKTNCSNYRRISLLPTIYTMVSNILVLRLTLYVDKTIEDHQYVFQHN